MRAWFVACLGLLVSTLLLIGTVVVSDSAQYYTGRAFGRRQGGNGGAGGFLIHGSFSLVNLRMVR